MVRNILILIAFVLVVFSPCLKAGFINLDDDGHLVNNPALHDLSLGSVKQIFTQAPNNTYIPLTILSFAIEKHFFGLNSFVFHLDNLLLFIGVVVLVLLLAQRLGLSAEAGLLAALLFAIHPMRVETVAWITERKDVLYACFYLLALHQYWSYLKTRSRKYYFATMILGLLSILAKPMALSLPLILLVLDWYEGRRLSKEVLIEKIPIFLYVTGIAGISYMLNMHDFQGDIFPQGLLIWIWSLVFYLWKFLFPFHVSPYYVLPHPVSIFYWPYFLSVAAFLSLIGLLIRFHKNRLFVFAFLYFFCSIFFLLRFNNKDFSIASDRFMFLPSLGFCFLVGSWVDLRIKTRAGIIIFYILLVLIGIKTNLQCRLWHDSISFWDAVIQDYPDYYKAYNNRGVAFYQQGRDDLALNDFNKAITLNPQAANAYNNRGIEYYIKGDDRRALADFNKAINLSPDLQQAHVNRAKIKLKE